MNSELVPLRIQERKATLGHLFEAGRLALELSNETTPRIDEQFLSIAGRVARQDGALFSVMQPDLLIGDARPDSIRHNRTLLQPNPLSTEEVNSTLGLIDLMLGDQVPELQSIFTKAALDVQMFEKLKPTPEAPGTKFLVVSNHLQLADQGFTMGLFHKVANEQGIDRLENHVTAVIGRAIGYFQFGDMNVVDDILRKVGSVLKTFPAGGSEALSDEEQALLIYRGICNHHTKQAFGELINSRDGRIIFMAPSGEQDKFDDKRHVVTMSAFGKATNQMMIDACKEGALVVPAFVDYGNDVSIVKFLDPRQVSSIEECHEIGKDIAMTGTSLRGAASSTYPDIKRFNIPIRYR
jgi:hypothetical protein